jgi:hypothetical protein
LCRNSGGIYTVSTSNVGVRVSVMDSAMHGA